jgi:hypothetical protein
MAIYINYDHSLKISSHESTSQFCKVSEFPRLFCRLLTGAFAIPRGRLADVGRDGRPEIILRMPIHGRLPWCCGVGDRSEGPQDLAEPSAKGGTLLAYVVCDSHGSLLSSIARGITR